MDERVNWPEMIACGSWPWWWFKLVKNSFLTSDLLMCPTIWGVLLLFFIIIIMSSLSFPAFYLALVPHQKESTATSPKKQEKKSQNWWVSKRKTCNLQSQNFYFLSTATTFSSSFLLAFPLWKTLWKSSDEKMLLLSSKLFSYNRIGLVV